MPSVGAARVLEALLDGIQLCKWNDLYQSTTVIDPVPHAGKKYTSAATLPHHHVYSHHTSSSPNACMRFWIYIEYAARMQDCQWFIVCQGVSFAMKNCVTLVEG